MPVPQAIRQQVLVLVAGLALAACTGAPQTSPSEAAPPAISPTEPAPPSTPGAEATQPAPVDTDAPPPATETATEAPDNGDSTESSMRGTWVGTVTQSTGTQGIMFVLRELGGVISGDILYDSGQIDNSVRGTRDGDTVTLVFAPSGTNQVRTYEGMVSGRTYSGSFTTFFGDQEAPGGPGSFEVTREE